MTDIDPADVTVLKLLARGRGPDWVANATGRKVAEVQAISDAHGGPTRAGLRQALAAANITDSAQAHTEQPRRLPVSAPTQTPATVGSPPSVTTAAGKLELLLARASQHDTAPVRAARNAVLTACTRLEGALQKVETVHRERQQRDAAKAAARSRVELLEKQLREAKAALKGTKPSAAAAPTRIGEDPKVVRAWARDNGVACPANGRVPAAVVEQFRAAPTAATG